MKAIGFSAVAATVVSFILWFINWSYWIYMEFMPYDSTRFESQKNIRYVFQGIAFFSTLTEYLALLLIAVGIVIAARRLPKS